MSPSPKSSILEKTTRWTITCTLAVAFLLGGIDITAFNLAIPWIQQDLNVNISMIVWTLNTYMIVFAGFLIPAGRLADMYGQKICFLSGIVVFAIASLVGTFSYEGWQLIVARSLQGLGSAFYWPTIQPILMYIFPTRTVGFAIGVSIGISAVGLSIGPIISGIILQYLSWRWILLVNVPLCIIIFTIIFFILPNSIFLKDKKARVDFLSILLFVAFFFTLIRSIALMGTLGYKNKDSLGWFALSISILWVFVARQNTHKYPIIKFELFQNQNFVTGIFLRFIASFGFFTTLFFTTYTLQNVASFSPQISALYFLPYTAGLSIMSLISGYYLNKVGFYPFMFGGLCLSALSLVAYGGSILYTFSFWAIFIPILFIGISYGLFFPTNNLYSIQSLPKQDWGLGTSILYCVILLSAAISIVVSSLFIMQMGTNHTLASLKEQKINISVVEKELITAAINGKAAIPKTIAKFSSSDRENIFMAIKDGFIYAMSIDLFVIAGVTLLILLIYFTLKSPPETAK